MINKQFGLELENMLKMYGICVDSVRVEDNRIAEDNYLVITCKGQALSFAEMCTISEILNTKKIDVGTETRDFGYCESCSYTETFHVLTVREYTIDKGRFETALLEKYTNDINKEVNECDKESTLIDGDLSIEFIEKLRTKLQSTCTIEKSGDASKYNNYWIVSWKELYEKKLREQDEEWERCWSKAGKLAGLAAFSNTSPKDNLPNVLLREVRRDGGLAFELTVQQAAELAAG